MVPKAPATADPIAIVVVDPDAPPVPMLTALARPVVTAPVASPTVVATAEVPSVTVAALSVNWLENVETPLKVWFKLPIVASAPVTFGKV